MLDGFRGERSSAERGRHEDVAGSLYYNWPEEFLEAGKPRLAIVPILMGCAGRDAALDQGLSKLDGKCAAIGEDVFLSSCVAAGVSLRTYISVRFEKPNDIKENAQARFLAALA